MDDIESFSSNPLREAERILARWYTPPSLLVDEELSVVHILGRQGEGRREAAPSALSAPALFGESATLELRIAIGEAKKSRLRVQRQAVEVWLGGQRRTIDFDVIPIESDGARNLFLVVVHENSAQSIFPVPDASPAPLIERAATAEGRPLLLVIDWSVKYQNLFRRVASEYGFDLEWRETLPENVPSVCPDRCLIFLDNHSAGEAFDRSQFDSSARIVWMSRSPSLEQALKAIQSGALDYLAKPFCYEDLAAIVARAKGFDQQGTPSVSSSACPARGFIGSGEGMTRVFKTLARASVVGSNVLITGETGTGKELVARAIHDNSARRNRPFVTVNCGALVETLLESELFGHVRGAFTGAINPQAGLFEQADGGTIFLDEIGDISLSLQTKLLRVLQEGEIRRVGGSETTAVDVRVIAATHRDLESMIEQGTFREDLFYRLRVMTIPLPPLRERLHDLPALVEFFLAKFSQRLARRAPSLSAETVAKLHEHRWPGNVRELEHAIEQALALNPGPVLYPEDFPSLAGATPRAPVPVDKELQIALVLNERERIERALKTTNYNKSRAADLLGISRVTLYRKVHRLRI